MRLSFISIFLFLPFVFQNYRLPKKNNKPESNAVFKLPDGIPRNIILVIGEGMGFDQLTAAAAINSGKLEMMSMPVTGFVQPWNKNMDIISGNDYYSLLSGNNDTSELLFKIIQKKKMTSSMVLTGSPTDDLPSSIFIKDYLKKDAEQRALEIFKDSINMIFSGGEKYFTARADKIDLTKEYYKIGYNVVSKIKRPENNKVNKIIGFASDEDLKGAVVRKDFIKNASLNVMSMQFFHAFGYFLLIDNNQISKAVQFNHDLLYAANETVDLDKTIKAISDKAGTKETLIIVLGSPSSGYTQFKSVNLKDSKYSATWQGNEPSAKLIPLFAQGPGSEYFSGTYSIDQVYSKLYELISSR
jgi:alkaline phosphatase